MNDKGELRTTIEWRCGYWCRSASGKIMHTILEAKRDKSKESSLSNRFSFWKWQINGSYFRRMIRLQVHRTPSSLTKRKKVKIASFILEQVKFYGSQMFQHIHLWIRKSYASLVCCTHLNCTLWKRSVCWQHSSWMFCCCIHGRLEMHAFACREHTHSWHQNIRMHFRVIWSNIPK